MNIWLPISMTAWSSENRLHDQIVAIGAASYFPQTHAKCSLNLGKRVQYGNFAIILCQYNQACLL